MEIGFIGLGTMGMGMAMRLITGGHNVCVFDIDTAAVGKAVDAGATAGTSPADVANRSEIVLCSLPIPQVVEQVMLGPDGIIAGSRVRIAIDLSTSGPQTAIAVANALSQKGIGYIDAPVSGGIAGATAGTLTIMASGEKAHFGEALPLLERIGGKVFYVGSEPGQGQAMKLVNNMLSAVTLIASCEALVFGAKAGLDAQTMIDILNISGGQNYHTKVKIPNSVLTGAFPNNFATELGLKDVRLAIESSEKIGVPLWTTHAARDFLAFAVSQGDAKIDWANAIRHFERWAGVEVRSRAPQTENAA